MKRSRIIPCAFSAILFFSAASGADIMEILISPVMMPGDSLPMHEINIKTSFDFGGSVKIRAKTDGGSTDTDKFDAGNNLSFASEYVKYLNEYVGAGAGISAQIPRGADGLSGKFGFAPIYLSVKVRSWPQEPGLYGYMFGQAGYNFFYGNSGFKNKLSAQEGGFYYGIGLGIIYKIFLIEGMFSVNSGVVKDGMNNRADLEYEKLTVSVGCRL